MANEYHIHQTAVEVIAAAGKAQLDQLVVEIVRADASAGAGAKKQIVGMSGFLGPWRSTSPKSH